MMTFGFRSSSRITIKEIGKMKIENKFILKILQ